jgi:hypothetical protein
MRDADDSLLPPEYRLIEQHLRRCEQLAEQAKADAASTVRQAVKAGRKLAETWAMIQRARAEAHRRKEESLELAMPTADSWTLEITEGILRHRHLLALAVKLFFLGDLISWFGGFLGMLAD